MPPSLGAVGCAPYSALSGIADNMSWQAYLLAAPFTFSRWSVTGKSCLCALTHRAAAGLVGMKPQARNSQVKNEISSERKLKYWRCCYFSLAIKRLSSCCFSLGSFSITCSEMQQQSPKHRKEWERYSLCIVFFIHFFRSCFLSNRNESCNVDIHSGVVCVTGACCDAAVRAVWQCQVQSGNQASRRYNGSPAGGGSSKASSICLLCNYSISLPKVDCQGLLCVCWGIRWISVGEAGGRGSHMHMKCAFLLFFSSGRSSENTHLFHFPLISGFPLRGETHAWPSGTLSMWRLTVQKHSSSPSP